MRYLPIAALAAAAASSVFAVLSGHHKKAPNKATESSKDMLPISRVVMYQSGIGYVERCAKIASDKLILRIRPDQINDILKSLTIIDRGNGRPVSISLPVDKDTLDSLAQIPEQIKDGGVRSLLNAFRGANVKIKTACRVFEGRIVGMDERDVDSNMQVSVNSVMQSNEDTVTLLSLTNVLHVIRLNEIRSVALYDQNLTDGLDKSLNISLNEGNWKQLELTIQLDSSEPREIAVSYIVAMPTWKPAYRLVLQEDDRAILQGWAVVSNVTGAHWNDIAFSLVSGQPMSFTYDLYTPQFLKRPDLSGLADRTAAAPEVIASGYGASPSPKPVQRFAPMGAAAPMGASVPMASMGAPGAVAGGMVNCAPKKCASKNRFSWDDIEGEASISDQEIANSFAAQAENAQIGSFDEYRLASKLTLPDGNTALVNLIHHEIYAKDTRLIKATQYNFDNFPKGWRQSSSFQTVELRNDSGLALNAGPITLYRDSAVIGEGYIARTEKDATAYITYAKEGRLSVTLVDRRAKDNYCLESFRDGCIIYKIIHTYMNKFQFESHIEHEITALLQIQRNSSLKPVDFPSDVIKSDQNYTIPVVVQANSSQAIVLQMQNTEKYSANYDDPNHYACLAIKDAIEQNRIPENAQDGFKQYLEDIEKKRALLDKITSLKVRKMEVEKDQRELTGTLGGLKEIESEDAAELKAQLIQRQQVNEQQLVNITKELYELHTEQEETELRLQTGRKILHYDRPFGVE